MPEDQVGRIVLRLFGAGVFLLGFFLGRRSK